MTQIVKKFSNGSSPPSTIFSMVRIVTRLRLGDVASTTVGTGFCVQDWGDNRCILTAAHVAGGGPYGETLDIKVKARVSATDSCFFRPSLTVQDDAYGDLALLLVPRGIKVHDPLTLAPTQPASPFSGMLYGFSALSNNWFQCAVSLVHEAPWLKLTAGQGEPGVSGGLVLAEGKVCGVYSGLYLSGELATAIQTVELEALRQRAFQESQ